MASDATNLVSAFRTTKKFIGCQFLLSTPTRIEPVTMDTGYSSVAFTPHIFSFDIRKALNSHKAIRHNLNSGRPEVFILNLMYCSVATDKEPIGISHCRKKVSNNGLL